MSINAENLFSTFEMFPKNANLFSIYWSSFLNFEIEIYSWITRDSIICSREFILGVKKKIGLLEKLMLCTYSDTLKNKGTVSCWRILSNIYKKGFEIYAKEGWHEKEGLKNRRTCPYIRIFTVVVCIENGHESWEIDHMMV